MHAGRGALGPKGPGLKAGALSYGGPYVKLLAKP